MEDGDTEKYQASSLIEDVVFSSRKWIVSGVFHRRYIINFDLMGVIPITFYINCLSKMIAYSIFFLPTVQPRKMFNKTDKSCLK